MSIVPLPDLTSCSSEAVLKQEVGSGYETSMSVLWLQPPTTVFVGCGVDGQPVSPHYLAVPDREGSHLCQWTLQYSMLEHHFTTVPNVGFVTKQQSFWWYHFTSTQNDFYPRMIWLYPIPRAILWPMECWLSTPFQQSRKSNPKPHTSHTYRRTRYTGQCMHL